MAKQESSTGAPGLKFDYRQLGDMSKPEIEMALIVVWSQLNVYNSVVEALANEANMADAGVFLSEESDAAGNLADDLEKVWKAKTGLTPEAAEAALREFERSRSPRELAAAFGRSLVSNGGGAPGALFALTGGAS